jgi:hypothetical protein
VGRTAAADVHLLDSVLAAIRRDLISALKLERVLHAGLRDASKRFIDRAMPAISDELISGARADATSRAIDDASSKLLADAAAQRAASRAELRAAALESCPIL